jgi:hypothetical protein
MIARQRVEFLGIIPRLIDPARFGDDPRDAFTMIALSLPGPVNLVLASSKSPIVCAS